MSKATTAATKEQLIELMQYLSQNISVPTIGIGGGFAPIGTIISYMGTTAPQDYLICDGTTYNIADYKQLSDFFAAQFGSANFFGGDGVTTFKVPDLRGEFLRGSGTNGHTDQGSGENVGEHQDGTEFPNIYSYKSSTYLTVSGRYPNTDGSIGSANTDKKLGSSSSWGNAVVTDTGSGSSYLKFTSRPTNTSVLYCIKAVVAGDVYSTTERVVGTWIDGKPVYEKTVTGTTNETAGQWAKVFVADNIDTVVNTFGKIVGTNGTFIDIGNYRGDSVEGWDAITVSNDNYATTSDKGKVFIKTGTSYTGLNFFITVQYTKTTD